MKVNEGYFSLDSLYRGAKYFLRKDGLFSHMRDRFIWYLCPRMGIVASFPTHVDIEISNQCQLQCPMCSRRTMNTEGGLMDFALYKHIIDQCAENNVYSIKLSWRGEPLLHPDIFKMILYAKNNKISDVAFLTNLERLDDDMAHGLVESGIDWISVSIDGMDENYNKIRYPSKFTDIVRKIKKINEIKSKSGKKKPLIRIQSLWSAIKSDPFSYKEFWTPLVDKINFIADQRRHIKDMAFPVDPSFRCQSPWLRMFITWDGKIGNCQVDYNQANVLGDATKQSLKDIWQGEKYGALRNLHKNNGFTAFEPCASCHRRGAMQEEVVRKGRQIIRFKSYVDQEFLKEGS